MKTILLWDPRFPDRRPARLTVEDTVASAAVRAGVAAAANPAEAGDLAAGGALDPGTLTEVALQHGLGNAIRRVFLPYSVALVGAAAGVLAAVGTPITGGVTPPPLPTLTLTGPLTYATNVAAGTLVANIGNVPAGVTPSLTPNDGRLVISGSAGAWTIVTGVSVSAAGTITLAVAAAGANGASAPVVVTAAGADADTTAYISRMSVAPSAEQASAYDYFVTQAKAIGVWPYITDCGFLCTHDIQSARLGVKNVTNLTQIGTAHSMTPGHAVTGNGTSQAFDTGYKFPATQQDNAHIGIYSYSAAANDNGDMGNANTVIIARGTADTASSRTNAASSGSSASVDGVGLFISNRTGSATTAGKLWKRNAVITASQGASAVPDATYTLWIGGRNGATPQYSNRGLAFWTIGTGMPDAIIAAYALLVEQTCAMLSASYTVAPVTTKTKALYRTMIRMTRQPAYLFGAFDNTYWGLGTSPNLLADISTMTSGKVPAIISHEWVDPLASDASAAGPAQLQRIKDHYAAGGIVSIHHHPGNPVTGSFEQLPSLAGTAGNQYDMNGNAAAACLAGGSRRTQFLAYVDRLIAFFKSCVDANGDPIPMIFRPWHENNGNFFWWTDSTTPANTAQLFRDTVDRIKAAGVQNLLYDWNSNYSPTPALGAYYPGLAYADFLSLDYYEAGATPNGMSSGEGLLGGLGSAVNRRPLHFAEIGYPDGAGTSSGLWTTRTGYYHRDRISRSSHFLPWRNPHAPKVGDATQSDFAAMIAEANCITRDRLSGVYS